MMSGTGVSPAVVVLPGRHLFFHDLPIRAITAGYLMHIVAADLLGLLPESKTR